MCLVRKQQVQGVPLLYVGVENAPTGVQPFELNLEIIYTLLSTIITSWELAEYKRSIVECAFFMPKEAPTPCHFKSRAGELSTPKQSVLCQFRHMQFVRGVPLKDENDRKVFISHFIGQYNTVPFRVPSLSCNTVITEPTAERILGSSALYDSLVMSLSRSPPRPLSSQ